MDLHLSGKRALVCASSKGIGRAIAEGLASEGVDLFLCARSASELSETADSIRSQYGVRVSEMAVDLADPETLTTLITEAQSQLGGIDILVNNVGGPSPSAAVDTPLEAWRKGFDQIFLSSTRLSQAVIPEMAERGYGRILTITSLSVVEPIGHLVVSTAMRAAVTAFAKTLSQEVAKDGITVHTLMPGIIHTDRIVSLRQSRAHRAGTTFSEEMAKTIAAIPMARLGEPNELADLAVFLASPRASYLTGLNLPIDGGVRKGWV